ncbi:MAG TPA: DNA repair exonuclease [Clostridiales bacterium]|nr:DNA repair exonuclease [Clostridiales bacterium]
MSRFRFVHAADVHLGSLLHVEGLESHPELQELCREATYLAFDNLCSMAVREGASFILLSGDLYDRDARSVRANRFFADACKKLNEAGIQVFVTAGNHDPLREHQEMFLLPDNTHLFPADRPEIYYVKNPEGGNIAAIAGQSYGSRQENSPLHLNYPSPDSQVFRIAMLHTQLEKGRSNYIPASLAELAESSSFDYWALGHIHKPQILRWENPVIAYSGSPQGRDFGEQQLGGCWLVEVDGRHIRSMEYRVTSPIVYQSLSIDIGCPQLQDADSLDDLEDYMLSHARDLLRQDPDRIIQDDQLEEHPLTNIADNAELKGCLIRWEIAGRGRLHHILQNDRQGSEQVLCQILRDMLGAQQPFIWTDLVQIRTANPVNADVLKQYPVLGQLLEGVLHSIEEDDHLRESLVSELGQAWTTAFHHEEQEEERLPLDEETLKKIIEDAKQLLLEGLAEGGEG